MLGVASKWIEEYVHLIVADLLFEILRQHREQLHSIRILSQGKSRSEVEVTESNGRLTVAP